MQQQPQQQPNIDLPPSLPSLPNQSQTTPNDNHQAIWYYEDKGERKGALTEADISQLIRSGVLGTQTGVWRKGFSEWTALDKTELRHYLDDSVPPPLSGDHVNNTVVWVLAFAPLIGSVLEYVVANIVHHSEFQADAAVANGNFFFVTIALNLVLSYWDESRLKKAGVQTEKFKGFVWLVPVYLYQRSKALKHNLAYFIVWIVCFVATFL